MNFFVHWNPLEGHGREDRFIGGWRGRVGGESECPSREAVVITRLTRPSAQGHVVTEAGGRVRDRAPLSAGATAELRVSLYGPSRTADGSRTESSLEA